MVKTLEQYFAEWESHVFGHGYGTGEPHVLEALKKFLGAVGRDGSERGYEYEVLEAAVTPIVAWLLIDIFCHQGLIDYGTSPRFGWLEEHGMALKAFVDGKTVDELVEICCEAEDRVDYCTPEFCNCGENGYSEKKLCHNPFWSEKNPR